MPTYSYNAKRGPAETVSGEMEAASSEAVIVRLEEMGLVPVKVSEKAASVVRESHAAVEHPDRAHKAPGSQVKVKSGDLDTFTRQLASLVKSSIPIIRAVTLLSKQSES